MAQTSSRKSTGGRRYGKKAGEKVEKATHEMKRSQLLPLATASPRSSA